MKALMEPQKLLLLSKNKYELQHLECKKLNTTIRTYLAHKIKSLQITDTEKEVTTHNRHQKVFFCNFSTTAPKSKTHCVCQSPLTRTICQSVKNCYCTKAETQPWRQQGYGELLGRQIFLFFFARRSPDLSEVRSEENKSSK